MGSDKALPTGKSNIWESDLLLEILGPKSNLETCLYLGLKKTNQELVNKHTNVELDPQEKNYSFDKWQPDLEK